jgi:hypothetical protein
MPSLDVCHTFGMTFASNSMLPGPGRATLWDEGGRYSGQRFTGQTSRTRHLAAEARHIGPRASSVRGSR